MNNAPPASPTQPPPPPLPPHSAQPTPGAATNGADIRPKARGLWTGGGIMALGIAAALTFGVVGYIDIGNAVDDFARVSDGTGTVRIESTGEYLIYSEGDIFFPSAHVTAPDGSRVATSVYSGDLGYGFHDPGGHAVGTFDAAVTGVYTVRTSGDVAIGKSIAGKTVRWILVPLAIAVVGFLIGLTVMTVAAGRRSGSRQQMVSADPSSE